MVHTEGRWKYMLDKAHFICRSDAVTFAADLVIRALWRLPMANTVTICFRCYNLCIPF